MSNAVMFDPEEMDLADMVARLPATRNTTWVVAWDPDSTGWRLERRGLNTGRCFEASVGFAARTRAGMYSALKGYVQRKLECPA